MPSPRPTRRLPRPFEPRQNTYVAAAHRHAHFGRARTLRVGGASHAVAYLRFRLPPLSGKLSKASLKLVLLHGRSARLAIRRARTNAWRESRVSFATAPKATGPAIRGGGQRRVISVDVTRLVPSRGGFTLMVSSRSKHTLTLASRERGALRAPRIALTVAGGPGGQGGGGSSPGTILFDDFSHANGPNNLITNEFAYWNPNDPAATKSTVWEMDSGTFSEQNGTGWTGAPDDCSAQSKEVVP